MAEVKWIKITTDMFDNRKVKHLRRLPDGNNIVLIWIMLLTMAGRCNSGGMIFLTENIPYTPKMLADELDFEENTVKLALEALERFGMIVSASEHFAIAGWQEYQNIEGMEKIKAQNRIRKQRQRESKKLALIGNGNVCEYCGNQGDTIDHIVPVASGGKDEKENTVRSCLACNMSKTDRRVDVFLNEKILDGIGFDVSRILSNEKIMRHVLYDGKKFMSRDVTGHVTQSHATDIDIEIDLEEDKENIVEAPKKEVRHKYGAYNNVLLSDTDIEKLKTEFKDYEERIERLSEYIASTGKSYKNHLATIRSWAKKDKQTKSYGRTAEEKNAGYCFNANEDSLDDLF